MKFNQLLLIENRMQTPAVAQANGLCTYVGTFLSPNIEIEWQSTKKDQRE